MKNRNALNGLIVVAVVVIVAGVAWFRTQRAESTSATVAPTTQAVTTPMPRMIDLGADKCIPCKLMAPILKELRKKYAGRAVVEFVDVWKNPSAGQEYGVRTIPTQIFFDRDGKEVWRHEGFLSKEEIEAKLKELGA